MTNITIKYDSDDGQGKTSAARLFCAQELDKIKEYVMKLKMKIKMKAKFFYYKADTQTVYKPVFSPVLKPVFAFIPARPKN